MTEKKRYPSSIPGKNSSLEEFSESEFRTLMGQSFIRLKKRPDLGRGSNLKGRNPGAIVSLPDKESDRKRMEAEKE